MNRRAFLLTSAAGLFLRQDRSAAAPAPLKLGIDNFSIRALNWSAGRLIDYAGEQRLDSLLLSDLEVFESHDESYLKALRERAARLGLEVQVGTGSVCPTSNTFDDRYGSAEDRLALTIRVARLMGASVARCYLGNRRDRSHPAGIRFHMEHMLRVLKRNRNRALDSGVKIAVENHAGDMQAAELVELIESAGTEFVGATIDAGNATWTLEDPMENLEILGPYALSSGVRDSMVWEIDQGVRVQWTAIGEGLVDWSNYFDRFRALCPNAPVQLEIISGFPRDYPYLEEGFWDDYPHVPAARLASFLTYATRGHPIPSVQFADGEESARQQYQIEELERSLAYCRDILGLGRKK